LFLRQQDATTTKLTTRLIKHSPAQPVSCIELLTGGGPGMVITKLKNIGRGFSSQSKESQTPVLIVKARILKAKDLTAKDRSGKSDPYLVLVRLHSILIRN
jgi:hypothetical protein